MSLPGTTPSSAPGPRGTDASGFEGPSSPSHHPQLHQLQPRLPCWPTVQTQQDIPDSNKRPLVSSHQPHRTVLAATAGSVPPPPSPSQPLCLVEAQGRALSISHPLTLHLFHDVGERIWGKAHEPPQFPMRTWDTAFTGPLGSLSQKDCLLAIGSVLVLPGVEWRSGISETPACLTRGQIWWVCLQCTVGF